MCELRDMWGRMTVQRGGGGGGGGTHTNTLSLSLSFLESYGANRRHESIASSTSTKTTVQRPTQLRVSQTRLATTSACCLIHCWHGITPIDTSMITPSSSQQPLLHNV